MSEINWPSAAKRERLRMQGIVPYSKVAQRCLVTLVVAVCLISWLPALFSLFHYDRLLDHSEVDVALVGNILAGLEGLFIGLSIAILAIVFLFGLAQTRFFFHPALCAFDFTRLWHSPLRGSVGAFLRVVLVVPIAFGICLAGGYALFPVVISGLNTSPRQIFSILPDSLPGSLFLFFGVLILIIAAAAQFHYFWTHRMSREELEQDARER